MPEDYYTATFYRYGTSLEVDCNIFIAYACFSEIYCTQWLEKTPPPTKCCNMHSISNDTYTANNLIFTYTLFVKFQLTTFPVLWYFLSFRTNTANASFQRNEPVAISSNALFGNSANNFFEPFSWCKTFIINIRFSLLLGLPFCFYPRDAMLASWFLHHLVAPRF